MSKVAGNQNMAQWTEIDNLDVIAPLFPETHLHRGKEFDYRKCCAQSYQTFSAKYIYIFKKISPKEGSLGANFEALQSIYYVPVGG